MVEHSSEKLIETTELAEGLTYKKRLDGINIFLIEKMSRECVNAWERQVIDLDQHAMAAGEHIRTILHVKSRGISFSAMTAIARTGREAPKGLVESTAVVLESPGFMLTMMRGIVRKLPRRARESIDFFDTIEAALKWLDQRKEEIDY